MLLFLIHEVLVTLPNNRNQEVEHDDEHEVDFDGPESPHHIHAKLSEALQRVVHALQVPLLPDEVMRRCDVTDRVSEQLDDERGPLVHECVLRMVVIVRAGVVVLVKRGSDSLEGAREKEDEQEEDEGELPDLCKAADEQLEELAVHLPVLNEVNQLAEANDQDGQVEER